MSSDHPVVRRHVEAALAEAEQRHREQLEHQALDIADRIAAELGWEPDWRMRRAIPIHDSHTALYVALSELGRRTRGEPPPPPVIIG